MWIGGFLAIAAAPVATVAAWSVQPLDQDDVAQASFLVLVLLPATILRIIDINVI